MRRVQKTSSALGRRSSTHCGGWTMPALVKVFWSCWGTRSNLMMRIVSWKRSATRRSTMGRQRPAPKYTPVSLLPKLTRQHRERFKLRSRLYSPKTFTTCKGQHLLRQTVSHADLTTNPIGEKGISEIDTRAQTRSTEPNTSVV